MNAKPVMQRGHVVQLPQRITPAQEVANSNSKSQYRYKSAIPLSWRDL